LLRGSNNIVYHFVIGQFVTFQGRQEIPDDQENVRCSFLDDSPNLAERIHFTLVSQLCQLRIVLDDSVEFFSKGMGIPFHEKKPSSRMVSQENCLAVLFLDQGPVG
jgi:hypothetical protein